MEEEGGSTATELPMCNCGKSSAVQMSTTEKKTLVGDFGIVRDEIYMKIKVQGRNVKKNKSTGTSKWVLPSMLMLMLMLMSCNVRILIICKFG